MIEEKGVVVGIEQGMATVEVGRTSSCGSCKAGGGCGSSVLAKAMGARDPRIQVIDHLKLHVGEQVVIGLKERALLSGAGLVYLLPLMTFFIGALFAQGLWGGSDVVAVLGGALGLILGLFVARRLSSRMSSNPDFHPVLLRRSY